MIQIEVKGIKMTLEEAVELYIELDSRLPATLASLRHKKLGTRCLEKEPVSIADFSRVNISMSEDPEDWMFPPNKIDGRLRRALLVMNLRHQLKEVTDNADV